MTFQPVRSDDVVCRDDRHTSEYRSGIRKLSAWHEECRRRRNGTFVGSFNMKSECGRKPKKDWQDNKRTTASVLRRERG